MKRFSQRMSNRRQGILKFSTLVMLVFSITLSMCITAFADSSSGTTHGGGGIKFGDETSSSSSSSQTSSSASSSASSPDDGRSTTHTNPPADDGRTTVHENSSGNTNGGGGIKFGDEDGSTGASTGGAAGTGSSSTNEDSDDTKTGGGGAAGGNIAGVDGDFPETHAPQIYDPTKETNADATLPTMGNGAVKGNEVENIEEFEEEVERGERSSLFDSILLVLGGVLFFYAALLILAYGLDRVSIFPNFSLLKLLTFGKYDIFGITVGQFIARDLVLIVAGILLGSGVAKKIVTLILIAFFNLFK